MIDFLIRLYLRCDWVVAGVVFLIVAMFALAAWWVRWLIEKHSNAEYLIGHDQGYLRGRRDERLVSAVDSALDLPRGADAHYPLIIERCPDGTTRRLDR